MHEYLLLLAGGLAAISCLLYLGASFELFRIRQLKFYEVAFLEGVIAALFFDVAIRL